MPIRGGVRSARCSVLFPAPSTTGTSLAPSPATRPSAAGSGNYSDTTGAVVEKTPNKHGTTARGAGWLLVGAALCVLLLAAASGGLPIDELLAVGRDSALADGVREGFVPGLSALDLFQLALALFVGLAFRRLLA
jgi:hypothetical protein